MEVFVQQEISVLLEKKNVQSWDVIWTWYVPGLILQRWHEFIVSVHFFAMLFSRCSGFASYEKTCVIVITIQFFVTLKQTNFVNLPYYIGTTFVRAWLWNIKTSIQTIITKLLSLLLLLLLLLHTNLCFFFIFLGIWSHNKRPGQRKSISSD